MDQPEARSMTSDRRLEEQIETIARWIVDLHGGEIRAAANHPHGCRMIVALPRAASEEYSAATRE